MLRCRPSLRQLSFSILANARSNPSYVGAVYSPPESNRLCPEGAAGKMAHIPSFSNGLLYRKQTLLFSHYLGKFAKHPRYSAMLRELRNDRAGFLLTGRDGVGKSVLLSQCVHFARAANVLTLYIPDCWLHTHGRAYIEPNPLLPGYFDNPKATKAFFQGLRTSQPHVLKGLAYTPPVALPTEGEEQPNDLLELVDWALGGIDRLGVATKLFMDAVCQLEDVPVLIALDGYNWFLHNTEYHFGEATLIRNEKAVPRVPADKLTIVRHLNHLLQCDPLKDNILCIAAVDTSHPKDEQTPFRPEFTVFHPLNVEPYTDTEMRTIIDYYIHTGPYAKHYNSESHVMPSLDRLCYKIGFLSDNIPHRVWKNFVTLPNWTYP